VKRTLSGRRIGACASRKRSYRHALSSGRIEKGAVASNHHDIRITDSFGSREVDCVISAQSTNLSQLASADSEGMVDLDEVGHLNQGVELSHSTAQLPCCEAAKSLGLGERSARLRIEEPDAHDPIGTVPQRCGASRAEFGDQQRHDG
jgi:hypothetical protein